MKGDFMLGRRGLSVVILLGMFVALEPVCWATPGDVDGANGVELKDAVLSLKVVAGLAADGATLAGDVDGDEAVGLAEAVFALRAMAKSGPTGRARAVLGPLAGATVKVYRLNDLENEIYSDVTDDEGYFDTQLLPEDLTKYVLVAVSGGEDVDADDDGETDPTPTPNAGTIHGLVTAAEFREGGFQVTALSDIVWRYTKNLTSQADADGISIRIRDLAGHFFGDNADFDGDGTVDAADICAFNPAEPGHRDRLNIDYAALLTDDPDVGKSVVDCYHENLAETLPVLLDKMFGHRLTRFPTTDPRYEKVRIEVSVFGEGGVESDVGGIRVVPEPAEGTENVDQAFVEQSAAETLTLTATPNPDPETEILFWVGCDSVSEDKTQCVVGRKMDRLVSVNFGYKETILQEGVDLVDLTTAQVIVGEGQVELDVTAGAGDSDMMATLADIQAGTIVVSGAGAGFLRRVVSSEKISAANYVLTTENAGLDEVIAQGTGAFYKRMTHGDLVDGKKRRTSADGKIRLIPSDDPNDATFTFQIGDPRKRDSKEGTLNWPSDDNPLVSLKGVVSMTVDIYQGADFGFGWPPLKEFIFVPKIRAEESLEVTAAKDFEMPDGVARHELPSLKFAPIPFSVGPVPVTIHPEVKIFIGLDGNAEMALTASGRLWQTAWAGIHYYRDSGIHPEYGFSNNHQFTPPSGQFSASLTPYVEVSPAFELYNATGPKIDVKGYFRLEAGGSMAVFSGDPCSGGLDAAAYAGIEADWGWDAENLKKLGKWTEKYIDGLNLGGKLIDPMEWDIRKWQIGGECVGTVPAHLDVTGLPVSGRVEKGAAEDVQQQYIVRNTGEEDLEWIVGYIDDGMLEVSPTSGNLGPNEAETVTMSLDAVHINSLQGLYINLLIFRNKSSKVNYAARGVMMEVTPPLPKPVLNPPESVVGSDGTPTPSLVDLSWTYADVGQAQGFEIYYTQTPDDLGSWRKAAVIVDPGRRAWRVSGLLPGASYYFQIKAYAGEMTPGASNMVSIETPAGDFANSLGMTFVRIPAGTFMMGSPESELGSFDRERPQHEVTLTQDFYMMTTEVTQAQWETVMGSNPSRFSNCGGDCPVEKVSWNDVQGFIAELNARGSQIYRLPTEAEWEYAARAGTTTAFYNGDITKTDCSPEPNLEAIGWYCGNSDVTYSGCYYTSNWGGRTTCAGTHPVAQKQPNAWGIYDMSGNVWEWVEDDWHSSYDGAPTDGSAWVDSPRDLNALRVIRGGTWYYYARNCRSASRYSNYPSYQRSHRGFRLALSPGR